MYERFTDRAHKVMQLANQEAQRFNHEHIDTEHVLLGLIKEGSGVAANVLKNLDVDLRKLRLEVEKLILSGPDMVTMGKLPQTPRSKRVIEYSMEEARHLNHNFVGTEHMLLGLLRVQEGIAAKVLTSLSMELEQVRTEVLNVHAAYPELEAERSTQRTRPSPPHPSKSEAKTAKEKELRLVTEEELASQREAMLTHTMRILDATFNRAMEGLRVTEDFVRFVLDDHHLTEALKSLRHELLAIIETLPSTDRFTSRDVTHDIGTEITTPGETERQDLPDVFFANMQRARQSLRSLEEFVKLIEPRTARQIEALRYRLYTIEKAVAVSYESEQRLQKVSLCVLIDGMNTVAKFTALVEQLLNAGVGMIQLRDDKLPDRELLERAHALVSQTTNQTTKQRDSSRALLTHALTIINNRPDIAAASGADGVHLGQDDLTVKVARTILGPRKLIGISTHSIEQARRAVLDGANYLGAGPTFPSTTKSFDQFPGLDYLREVTAKLSLPIFAIGGIQAENLPEVLETGVTRIAVSGAVARAPNPGEDASVLLGILRGATTR